VSQLADPQRIAFLSELAKLLSSRGWVTLNQLRAGDRPIAWLYTFQFARHWSFYQMTFDRNFSEYSPGSGLRLKVIEEACQSADTDFVDLGLGREHHKQRWATATRETVNVTLAKSKVTYLRVAARYHAAAAIKSTPRLEQYVRRVLGRPSMGNLSA
jgi:CelD/BcsL family acetyltransferase involved in cellulose biosynthesis